MVGLNLSLGLMDGDMKEAGRMESNMAKGCIIMHKEGEKKENGKMGNECAG